MTTHRSLNKLEFKAHMSIHNIKEVAEAETHEAGNRTRDRFGKTHALSNEDGTSRLPRRQAGVGLRSRRLKVLILAVLLGPFCQTGVFAEEPPPPRRNTDVQVGSENIDPNTWLDQRVNKSEDNFGIPIDESTAIGINDNGDPNVGMKF